MVSANRMAHWLLKFCLTGASTISPSRWLQSITVLTKKQCCLYGLLFDRGTWGIPTWFGLTFAACWLKIPQKTMTNKWLMPCSILSRQIASTQNSLFVLIWKTLTMLSYNIKQQHKIKVRTHLNSANCFTNFAFDRLEHIRITTNINTQRHQLHCVSKKRHNFETV